MIDQPPSKSKTNPEWKILIIDDDEDDFLIAQDMLKEARGRKFEIHWANTFTAGQEDLKLDYYNAVLVDYDLGIRSGIELIREASEQGYAAPLILFTGRGNYEVDVEAMEAGATLYLSKGEATPLLLERAIRYAIELKQKEQSLRESEAALRISEAKERAKVAEMNAILDAVPAIVWITYDNQAEEVTGNQAAHDFLRVPVGNNLSKSAPEKPPRNFQVYQDGRELSPEELPLQITAATGQPIRNFEEEVVFEDGDRAHLLGNVTPLLDDDGHPRGAVGAFINITERKQAEAAILENRARLEAALASMQDAVFISDAGGNLIELNDAFATFHRFANKEECAKTLAEYPDIFNLFLPDGTFTPVEMWPVHRSLRGETATNAEYILRRRDTGEQWVGSYSFSPIHDEQGAIVGSVVVGRDITQSKQAEALVQQSLHLAEEGRRTLEALMEYIPEGITIADAPDVTIRMVSRYGQEILGGPQEQMTAEQVADEWKVYDRDGVTPLPPELLPLFRAIRRGEVVKNQDLVQVNSKGQHLYLSCNAGPIRDAAGNISGGVVAWREISDRKQAEQALRLSEERFNRAFNANPNAMLISSVESGQIEVVNDSFVRLFGYSQDELLGKTARDLDLYTRPVEREAVVQEIKANRFVRDLELDLYTKTRSIRTVKMAVEMLNIGGKTALLTVYQDITEQKKLQEKNQEQTDLLERLVQSAPAGIAFVKGPSHIYTLANQEFHQFARGKGVLIGRTVAEVWSDIAEIVIPQHDRVFQTGESFSTVNAPFTIIRDGVATENYYTYTHTPIYKADGSIEGVMTLAIDTTQTMLNRKAVETQSARLDTVLQALPVGVWITDAGGRIVGKNEQADRIWAGDAPLVEGFEQYHAYQSWDVQTGRKLETEDFPLTQALRTGQPVEPREHRIRRFDGSDGYVLVSAMPIKDSEGRLVGAVATNLDITDRVQADLARRNPRNG